MNEVSRASCLASPSQITIRGGPLMSAARPLSGLQKQILALYRKCLRQARVVDPERAKGHEALIKQQFRKVRNGDGTRLD